MLSGPSFRSIFVFSINSLIFCGFPLTFSHLAEASLSALSWLYTLVCAVVQKYHEMSFIYNYSHFKYILILQSICFICTTWKRKQTTEQQLRRAKRNAVWTNEIKTKTKPSHRVTFKLTTPSMIRFGPQKMFDSLWCLVMAQIQFSLKISFLFFKNDVQNTC